ncbi:MAG: zinc ABC transporter substrate-binding protein [Micromonosporaceae bacterium]|nr:zinc ABC transporter substrate-binding protein [Micromonosporaceae bacterium]
MSGSGGGTDGRLSIVAGFYPLQFVAERIGGERVRTTALTQPGAEPHDLELSPRQVAELSTASLVLYLHGFQPAVDEAVQQADVTALDVATLVPLLTTDHDRGAGEAEEHGAAERARDPHVWLDPTRLATIADAVATTLAELDPDGATGYQERAAGLRADLTALDREFADGLRDCARREIVVSHAAFGYLADRYDLRQIPITGLAPDTEPTPGELAAAVDAARAVGATTIFFETLISPAVAQTVADAVGADAAVLDPIEGLAPGAAGDYLSVMRANLAALRPALGCSR